MSAKAVLSGVWATSVALAVLAPAAAEDRLQIGIYKEETPLGNERLEPRVVATKWSRGDLQVLIDQAAPCGDTTVPADPVWDINGQLITMRYRWNPMPEEGAPPPELCMKHLQAWVFRVPEKMYQVVVSKQVPRFAR